MEIIGSCIRKFPGGRRCGRQTPGPDGVYTVLDEQAFYAQWCTACKAELLETYYDGAQVAQWRKTAPKVSSRDERWDPTEVRLSLRLAGFPALAPPSGPLTARADARWQWLVEQYPDLLQRVKEGRAFTPEEQAKILEQIARNRQAPPEPDGDWDPSEA